MTWYYYYYYYYQLSLVKTQSFVVIRDTGSSQVLLLYQRHWLITGTAAVSETLAHHRYCCCIRDTGSSLVLLLFSFFVASISGIISRSAILFHQYTDHAQLYIITVYQATASSASNDLHVCMQQSTKGNSIIVRKLWLLVIQTSWSQLSSELLTESGRFMMSSRLMLLE